MFGFHLVNKLQGETARLAFSGLITEYTTTTMNPAVFHLLCRAIEEYVSDFCELCHLVDFNDVALH